MMNDYQLLALAQQLSKASPDPSTKVGAVVASSEGHPVALGWNRFPECCDHDPRLYEDRTLKYERILHAEIVALLRAGMLAGNAGLFVWGPATGPCCGQCAAIAVEMGISRVVYIHEKNEFSERWAKSLEAGTKIFWEAGAAIVAYTHQEFNRGLIRTNAGE